MKYIALFLFVVSFAYVSNQDFNDQQLAHGVDFRIDVE